MGEIAERLERLFHPRSVAVVGSKRLNDHNWLRNVLPFQGAKYHVNVDREEWPSAEALGFPNYASLLDIPGDVDYVIFTIPAAIAPRVLDDCIRKGVVGVHMFTAGFSETGTEEGLRLEQLITQKARDAGLLLVGPNGMGIYNPKIGLRFNQDHYYGDYGNLAFISQSGTQSIGFAPEALYHGLRVSKMVSMGNGVVLDSPDYLEYFAEDPDTQVIGMFLEGVRDHRRLFETLRAVCQRKPVLVWKVGQTEDAARATAAHSGSLTRRPEVWDAMLRQCGAIGADNVDEVINTAKALLYVKPFTGLRLGLVAVSGGHATEMANIFSKAGFRVPALADRSYERILDKLKSLGGAVGGSYRNPLEGAVLSNEASMENVLTVLNEDENVDGIVHEINLGMGRRDPSALERRLTTILEFSQRTSRPYAVVISLAFPQPEPQLLQGVYRRLMDAGVPTFYGFASCAKALINAARYHQFRAEIGQ